MRRRARGSKAAEEKGEAGAPPGWPGPLRAALTWGGGGGRGLRNFPPVRDGGSAGARPLQVSPDLRGLRRTGRASLAAGLAGAVAVRRAGEHELRGGAAPGGPVRARLCKVRLNQAGLCGMGADASSRWRGGDPTASTVWPGLR